MSAESKDVYAVYNAKMAKAGEAKDVAADKAGSLQMKADKAALQRQIKRLDAAIARNKADYDEGKMAAESMDAEKIYRDKPEGLADAMPLSTRSNPVFFLNLYAGFVTGTRAVTGLTPLSAARRHLVVPPLQAQFQHESCIVASPRLYA